MSGGQAGGAGPRALSGRPRAVIIAYHENDAVVEGAIKAAESLSMNGHLSEVLIVRCKGSAPRRPLDALLVHGRLPEYRFETTVLRDGTQHSVDLSVALHDSGDLERTDIMSVASSALDDEGLGDLAGSDRDIRSVVGRTAAKAAEVVLHRVWVPDYGDSNLAPPEALISTGPDRAYVVVPLDAKSDRRASVPVSAEGEDITGAVWHAAVEVIGLSGLWATMDGAPLEDVKAAHGGVGEPLVRLVRSSAKCVSVKVPNMIESSDPAAGSLPLVHGFVPDPAPETSIPEKAARVIPEHLIGLHRLESTASGVHRKRNHARAAAEDAAKTHRALLPTSKPCAERRGSEEIDVVPGRNAAEGEAAVGRFLSTTTRHAGWTDCLWDPATDGPAKSPRAITVARDSLEESLPRVSLGSVPSDAWDQVLSRLFGIVDGSHGADELREMTVGLKYLAVDPTTLGPETPDLKSVLRDLEPVDEADHAPPTSEDDDQVRVHDKRSRRGPPVSEGPTQESDEPQEKRDGGKTYNTSADKGSRGTAIAWDGHKYRTPRKPEKRRGPEMELTGTHPGVVWTGGGASMAPIQQTSRSRRRRDERRIKREGSKGRTPAAG